MAKIWKCVCGVTHVITGQAIRCSGPGHLVYLAPAFFEYGNNKATEAQPKPAPQTTLF